MAASAVVSFRFSASFQARTLSPKPCGSAFAAASERTAAPAASVVRAASVAPGVAASLASDRSVLQPATAAITTSAAESAPAFLKPRALPGDSPLA